MTDPIVLQSTGDVTGPVSSTNNSMVLFDGTTGKKIKGNNAVVTTAGLALLDDNNNKEQRATLGLGTIATQNSNAVTISGGSVTGITDLAIGDGGTGASTAAQARINLGINFGTSAGTYMEGNDTRVVNAVPKSRIVYALHGCEGGGNLGADTFITVGPPSTLGNGVGNGSYLAGEYGPRATHTHAIDIASFFERSLGPQGWYKFPGGLILQWGQIWRDDIVNLSNYRINYHFSMNPLQVFAISRDTSQAVSVAVGFVETGGFTAQCWERDGAKQSGNIAWFALGMT